MASGYPIQWSGNEQWPHNKDRKPIPSMTIAEAQRIAAERSVDPFKLLHNMLDPWTFGFERHLEFMKNLSDVRIQGNYPPYNIKTLPEDKAVIEIAIAGFKKTEIDIEYKENIITVKGEKAEDDESTYAYKGIAGRNFVQTFAVADDVIVKGANMEDGFLMISLERIVPEEKKAKKISIK